MHVGVAQLIQSFERSETGPKKDLERPKPPIPKGIVEQRKAQFERTQTSRERTVAKLADHGGEVSDPTSVFSTLVASKSESFGPFPQDKWWDDLVGPFRDAHADHHSFAFDQNVYISGRKGPEREGVCRAACLAWVGRNLHGKVGFEASKKGPQTSAPWSKRMAKKVGKYARGQSESVDKNLRDAGLRMHDGVNVFMFDFEALTMKTGDSLMDELRENVEPNRSYLISIVRDSKAGPSGHAVAMTLTQDEFLFLDPNVGEFRFPVRTNEDGNKVVAFMNDWYGKIGRRIGGNRLVISELSKTDA